MKRKIHIAILVSLFTAVSAYGQETIVFGEKDVQITLPLTVSRKEVKANYAMHLTPALVSGSDTLRLKEVVFRSKRNNLYTQRGRKFGTLPQATTDELLVNNTLTYNARANREDAPWLWNGNGVKLIVERKQVGCCDSKVMEPQMLAQSHYEKPAVKQSATPPPTPQMSKTQMLMQENPLIVSINDYKSYDKTVPLRKQKGALIVYFPVTSAEVDANFRDNAATLEKIVSITKQIVDDPQSEVKVIQIVGLASVEGSQQRNDYLAGSRAQALKKAVQERVSVPDELFECINGGEAWADLRDQIEETQFEGRDELLNIIDSEKNADRRKQKIRTMRNGETYNYLKQNILGDQRNSGFIRIYIDEKKQQ
ncbi:MAG: hypothetical protein HUK08_00550 [Bacteroidaceae bacterium]|nr:hypothetical protein [Bacteroidaceae bacterium]